MLRCQDDMPSLWTLTIKSRYSTAVVYRLHLDTPSWRPPDWTDVAAVHLSRYLFLPVVNFAVKARARERLIIVAPPRWILICVLPILTSCCS